MMTAKVAASIIVAAIHNIFALASLLSGSKHPCAFARAAQNAAAADNGVPRTFIKKKSTRLHTKYGVADSLASSGRQAGAA